MKRLAAMGLLLLTSAPMLAGVRKNTYPMPCSALWPAAKGTVRNSGDYAVVFLDHDEMIASFAIGMGQGFRLGSAVLNPKGDTPRCRYKRPNTAVSAMIPAVSRSGWIRP